MRRRPGSRAAVSTAISNVLMTAIVIFLGVLVALFAATSIMSQQGSAGVWFLSRGEAFKEMFTIEAVLFNNSGTYVYVRNSGAIEVDLDAIYIDGARYSSPSLPVSVAPGKVAAVFVPMSGPSSFDWRANRTPLITVASLRGNQVSTRWVAQTT